MWICTNKGFISVVEDRHNSEMLVVRGRNPKHLREIFPDHKLAPNGKVSDYCCRIYMPRKDFELWMRKQISDLDYENFKDSVDDFDLHEAYTDFWLTMREYQDAIEWRDRVFSSRS